MNKSKIKANPVSLFVVFVVECSRKGAKTQKWVLLSISLLVTDTCSLLVIYFFVVFLEQIV